MNAKADMANARRPAATALASKKLAASNPDVQQTRLSKAKTDRIEMKHFSRRGAITPKAIGRQSLETTTLPKSNISPAWTKFRPCPLHR